MAISAGEIEGVLRMRDEMTAIVRTAMDVARREMGATQQSAKGLGGILQTAVGTLGGFVGGQAIMGLLSQGFNMAKSAVFGMNSTLETAQQQFTTLMKDADAAKEHVAFLFEFAKKTPFETGPILAASRTLLTFGGAALNTKENLTLVGDAAAVANKPINEIAFWIGRAYSAIKNGQPFGEASMRLQELSILSGSTRTQMEALGNSAEDNKKKWELLRGELEKSKGAMEKQAGTWVGVTSTLSDTIQILSAKAFKPLFDLVVKGIGVFNEFIGQDWIADGIGAIADVISGVLNVSIGKMLDGVKLVFAAWQNLKAPLDGVASTLGAKIWADWGGLIQRIGADVGALVKQIAPLAGAVGESLKQIGSSIWTTFVSVISSLSGALAPVASMIWDLVKAVYPLLAYLSSQVWDTFAAVIGFIGKLLSALAAVIEFVFRAVYKVLQITGLWNAALWVLDKVLKVIVGGATFVLNVVEGLAKGFGWAAEKVEQFAKWLTGFVKETPPATGAAKDLNLAVEQTGPAIAGAAGAAAAAIPVIEDWTGSNEDGAKAAKAHAEEIKKLRAELSGANTFDAANNMVEALKGMPPVAKLTSDAIGKVNATMRDAVVAGAEMGRTVSPMIKDLYLQTEALLAMPNGANWKTFYAKWESDWKASLDKQTAALVEAQNKRNQIFRSSYDQALQLINDERRARLSARDLALEDAKVWRDQQYKDLQAVRVNTPATYEAAADAVDRAYQRMVQSAQTSGQGQKNAIQTALAELPNVVSAAVAGGGNPMKAVMDHIGKSAATGLDNAAVKNAVFGATSKIFGKAGGVAAANFFPSFVSLLAQGKGTEAAAGAGASIGGAIATNIGKAVATKVGGALGATLGSAIPVVGTLLGGLAGKAIGGLVGKLFGGGAAKKEAEAFRQEVIKSAGGLEQLKEKAKKAGVSLEKFFAAKNKGDVEKAVAEMNKGFEAADKKLQALANSVTLVNQRAALFGKQFGAAAEQFAKSLPEGVAATKDNMGGLVSGFQADFDRVGTYAAAVFAGMRKNGSSVMEVIGALGPTLATMRTAINDFGFVASGAVTSLLDSEAIVTANADIFEGLDLNTKMITEFGAAGILTKDLFNTIGADIGAQLSAMAGRGVDMKQALGLVAPTLQKLWEGMTDFGAEVDETTKALIEQGVEAGVVGDKHRNAQDRIAVATEKVAEVVEKLARHFGVTFPDAVANGAKKAADALSGQMSKAAADAQAKLGGIKARVDVPVYYHGQGFPEAPQGDTSGNTQGAGDGTYVDPNMPQMAKGGVTRGPTLAGEGGDPEIVGPVDFMTRVTAAALARTQTNAGIDYDLLAAKLASVMAGYVTPVVIQGIDGPSIERLVASSDFGAALRKKVLRNQDDLGSAITQVQKNG